jgi:hypothetical protein
MPSAKSRRETMPQIDAMLIFDCERCSWSGLANVLQAAIFNHEDLV